MAIRSAFLLGAERVIAIDDVPARISLAAQGGADVLNFGEEEVFERLKAMTGGRGPDACIDAVGMEAHGTPSAHLAHKLVGLLPDKIAEPLMLKAGIDRLAAFTSAIDGVRRGGTVSVSGVYGGAADPLPFFQMFDKQIQLRMGQANVRRWSDDIVALLDQDEDVLGVEGFATHHLPLAQAPEAYATFQAKEDGAVKIVFRP
jgi:threonine dehydrogenase-like Zn-dependent dehydrogenase